MTDLPPRFITDLEENLTIPTPPLSATMTTTTTASRQSTTTTTSSSSQPTLRRRWDDPPDDEPITPPENPTTMLFIKKNTKDIRPTYFLETEIMHLTFSPSDTHLVASIPSLTNARTSDPDGPFSVVAWSVETGQRVTASWSAAHGPRVGRGGFAVNPGSGADHLVVACPFVHPVTMARLEVHDMFLGRNTRLLKQDLAVRAPVAWSADGEVLAGVSMREPSRVVVLHMAGKKVVSTKMGRVLMGHVDEVTQLAFLPPAAGEGGGRALVSAGRDGCVRVTSVESGMTLKKMEVAARAPASILRVSPDGKLVVTVWGRDVVLWYLDSGRVHSYHLNAVRQSEGWPLCVSPDCRYLACRTEDGFDVSDAATGKFRGEYAWAGSPITSAAFNSDGTRLAVGNYCGGVQMFDIVTP